MTSAAAPPLGQIAASWYESFIEQGGREGRGPAWMIEHAEGKAYQYVELGTAYDDFQPGNGTSYKLILHDLVRPAALAQLDKHNKTEHHDGSACTCAAGQPVDINYFRPTGSPRSMAAYVGGEMLVSLPENNGGVCAVFSVHMGGLYTPDYVMERLGMRLGDALPLSVYLSAFTDLVSRLRDSGG